MIKEFIKGFIEGIKSVFNSGILELVVFSTTLSLPFVIIVGHFTNNLGIAYMNKLEATKALLNLWIIHFIITIFIMALLFIFILRRNKKMELNKGEK
ncbi:MAG: hypothetical protein PHY08_11915 [Candidatus Cloacimonetes bacterium]|nr:hypothetical protein [Candidatus Cloacimonadota bacterium]